MKQSSPKEFVISGWKNELDKAAFKYHVLIAWVAVALNPVWAIGDYYTIPHHFNDFLIFRIVVSALTLGGILLKDKFRDKPEVIAFIPFAGISIQNAYMYSVMDIPQLQKHTFAYIALFIGAGMFVLWRPVYSIMIVVISFIANIIFCYFNSHLQVSDMMINGGMLTTSVALFTILLINTRTNLTKKEIIARLALGESLKQIEEKSEIIEEKNKDISDSINYAQRIQHALLPPLDKLDKTLEDYFILYKPKDVVSGDFYWHTTAKAEAQGNKGPGDIVVIGAVDCTGHGVPGALMSIVGSTLLNQAVKYTTAIKTPADALGFLNMEVTNSLNSIRDGMDMALCAIDLERM